MKDLVRICVPYLAEGVPAMVQVVNDAGEAVAQLYNATPEGDLGLCLSLNCSKLAAGTYFALFKDGNQEQSVKFAKQ